MSVSQSPAQSVPWLTDGVVLIRPMLPSDAAAHLAGEDGELVRWLSGARSTLAGIHRWIDHTLRAWEAGGPAFTFSLGARNGDDPTGVAAGTVHINNMLAIAGPGQVNIAYGIYPPFRGQGLAQHAVELARVFAATLPGAGQALIRAAPVNPASAAVALRCGFRPAGHRADDEGGLDWFLRTCPLPSDHRHLRTRRRVSAPRVVPLTIERRLS